MHVSTAYGANSDQVIRLLNAGSSGSYARSAVRRSHCRPARSGRNREGHRQRGGLPHVGENQAGCAVRP